MNPESYANNSYNSFDYVGNPTYARKQPQVEEEVIDETVEEWEEEREDGTKVVVRKRTKRTKTTKTRELYEPSQYTWTSGSSSGSHTHGYSSDINTNRIAKGINTLMNTTISEEEIQKLVNELDSYSNKPILPG